MLLVVIGSTAAMGVVMLAGWTYQRARLNGGWTDVFWTLGAGVVLPVAALVPVQGAHLPSWRQALVAALAATWGLRLGTYMLTRVARSPHEDVRYTEFRSAWGADFQRRMFGFLMTQAGAAGLLSITVLFAARNPAPGVRLQDVAGAALLAAAILGEAIADGQMKRFKASNPPPGAVCETGLWRLSRHPNYLFEWIGWLAYPVIAIRPSHPETLASLVAPAIMYAVLRFGTGVPPLEAAMLRSKGDAYRVYQSRVGAFFPRVPLPSSPAAAKRSAGDP